jgi:hypothetical protein
MVRIIFPDIVAPPFLYAQSAVTSFGLGSDRRRSLLTAKLSQGASRCPNLMFVVNGSSSVGVVEREGVGADEFWVDVAAGETVTSGSCERTPGIAR